MSRLLLLSSLRTLRRHPWQAVFSVLGVAVGVAVVVSIGLANASARRAFDLSTEALTGRATHQIVGGPQGVPEELFPRLVTSGVLREASAPDGRGRAPAAPVVEGYGTGRTQGHSGLTLRILGVDPFSEAPFRPYLAALEEGVSRTEIAPLVTRPGTGLLTPETADELGVAPGEGLTVSVGGVEHRVDLLGLIEPGDERSRRALRGLLVLDVSSAQEVLGRLDPPGASEPTGRLDRIDLILPQDPVAVERFLERLEPLLPPGTEVRPAASRSRTFEQMTRAFRLNLTALSLLALVCGMFLIYNTMTFAVVQRRTLFGTLRALGTTRREVLATVLAEATAVALLGTVLGLAAGIALGQGLVRLVTRTINDLYFVLSVRELEVAPEVLLLGAALGVGATLASALHPALEATSSPPRAVLTRSTLESRTRHGAPRAAGAGLVLGLVGGVLLALPTGSGDSGGSVAAPGLLPAFAGLLAVIVGAALTTPAATVLLMKLLRRPAGALFGVLGRMAARGVVAGLSRTGVAIAALAVAVSVSVGVGVMISSFRQTVVSWLDLTLQADVYVRPPGPDSRPGATPVAPEALERIRTAPGVERVGRLRRAAVRLAPEGAASGGPLPTLLALELDPAARTSFRLTRGDPDRAWSAVATGDAVLVSEPFSLLRGVEPGETLRLRTPSGPQTFRVAAVYSDYGTDPGAILLSLETYRRLWRDPSVDALSIDAAPGTEPDELAEELRARTAGVQELLIRSNRTLRRLSLEIFDRTFVVTDVLRLLAGLVAFIGVLSALMALELERARELGVLRANGLTPGQVWKLVTSETGLMGLAAGLLSLPLGVLLAVLMIRVINRRSFGWTLEMELTPGALLGALALALGAALLAGLYPAWRMSRVSPAEALREE